jgi:hypothetical protein
MPSIMDLSDPVSANPVYHPQFFADTDTQEYNCG